MRAGLAAALAVLAAGYAVMLVWVLAGPYAPAFSDEFAYFQDARSFAQNGTLDAVYLLDGRTAPVAGLGPHGPGHALLLGLVGKLSGQHYHAIAVANAVFVALGVAALWAGGLRGRERAVATLAVLAFPLVPVVFLGYVQEAAQIGLAAATGAALVAAYRARDEGRSVRPAVIAAAAAITAASLLRPSAVLLAAALVALAGGRRGLAAATAAFAAACVAAAAYLQLFYASGSQGVSQRAQAAVDDGGIGALVSSITGTVGDNVTSLVQLAPAEQAYWWLRPVTVVLVAVLLAVGLARRDRLALAAGLAGALTVLALLTLYDLAEWTGLRMLGPVFVLSAVVLAVRGPLAVLAAAVVVSAVALVPAGRFIEDTTLPTRRDVGERAAEDRRLAASVASLRDTLRCTPGRVTVLASRELLRDAEPGLAMLPVRAREGCAVRYVFSIERPDLDPRQPVAVQYLLAPTGAAVAGAPAPVLRTPVYDLYTADAIVARIP